jgi:hypothetical protein
LFAAGGQRGGAGEPSNAKEDIPALIEAIRDKDPLVRRRAAEALGKMGPEAKQAIPALKEALAGTDFLLQQTASEVLAKMGPAAIPALTESLRGKNPFPRGYAAAALSKMGPEAVPSLTEAFRDERIRPLATAVARDMKEPKAVAALTEALRNAGVSVAQRPDEEQRNKVQAELNKNAQDRLIVARKNLQALFDARKCKVRWEGTSQEVRTFPGGHTAGTATLRFEFEWASGNWKSGVARFALVNKTWRFAGVTWHTPAPGPLGPAAKPLVEEADILKVLSAK